METTSKLWYLNYEVESLEKVGFLFNLGAIRGFNFRKMERNSTLSAEMETTVMHQNMNNENAQNNLHDYQ